MTDLIQEVKKLNEWNDQGRFEEVLIETNTDLDQVTDENTEEEVASIHIVRGNALYGLGRFEEAVQAYAKAIELDTFDVQARCNYGSALYTLGRYVDALNACDAAILTDDTFAPAYINAAHCLAALKHEEEAVYALKQAFTLDPKNYDLGRAVADMAADLENFEVAFEVYLKIAALPDAAKDIHETIAAFLKKSRETLKPTDWQKAVDTWRRQYITNPEVLRLSADLMR